MRLTTGWACWCVLVTGIPVAHASEDEVRDGHCTEAPPPDTTVEWLDPVSDGDVPSVAIIGAQWPEYWLEFRLSAGGRHETWSQGPWLATSEETPIFELSASDVSIAEVMGSGGIVSIEVAMVFISEITGQEHRLALSDPRWFTRTSGAFAFASTLDGVEIAVEPIEGELPIPEDESGEPNQTDLNNPEHE